MNESNLQSIGQFSRWLAKWSYLSLSVRLNQGSIKGTVAPFFSDAFHYGCNPLNMGLLSFTGMF